MTRQASVGEFARCYVVGRSRPEQAVRIGVIQDSGRIDDPEAKIKEVLQDGAEIEVFA